MQVCSFAAAPDLDQPSDEARAFCLEMLPSLTEPEHHFDRWIRA